MSQDSKGENYNPYEAASVSSDFRGNFEGKNPNRIEWGNVVLCYLMGLSLHLVLIIFVSGLIGFLTGASIERPVNSINIILLKFATPLLTLISLIICVSWLVRKVRSRKFVHATIFAAANFAIDMVLAVTYSSRIDWEQCASIPGQVIVILVTAWLVTVWLEKRNARTAART